MTEQRPTTVSVDGSDRTLGDAMMLPAEARTLMTRRDPTLPEDVRARLNAAIARAPVPGTIGERLLERAAAARRLEAPWITRRAATLEWRPLAPGLERACLYRHRADDPPRAGEARETCLLRIHAGADIDLLRCAPVPGCMLEWVVLEGCARIDGHTLRRFDLRRDDAYQPSRQLASAGGALIMRRSPLVETAPATLRVVAASKPWEPFRDGVQRVRLWHGGGQSAVVGSLRAGSRLPAHEHPCDEECIVLSGEVYFGDLLLRAGDFHLAPAGCAHPPLWAASDALLFQRGPSRDPHVTALPG